MSQNEIERANIKSQVSVKPASGIEDSKEVAKLTAEIKQSPFDGELRLALAKAYAAQFRFADAIDEYSYVIATNPDLREAFVCAARTTFAHRVMRRH